MQNIGAGCYKSGPHLFCLGFLGMRADAVRPYIQLIHFTFKRYFHSPFKKLMRLVSQLRLVWALLAQLLFVTVG